MTRKGLIEMQHILNEHELYSDIIEHLLMVYFEKREIFYDRDRGVWYSRINARDISLAELDDLCLEVISYVGSNISKEDDDILNLTAKQHIFDSIE